MANFSPHKTRLKMLVFVIIFRFPEPTYVLSRSVRTCDSDQFCRHRFLAYSPIFDSYFWCYDIKALNVGLFVERFLVIFFSSSFGDHIYCLFLVSTHTHTSKLDWLNQKSRMPSMPVAFVFNKDTKSLLYANID